MVAVILKTKKCLKCRAPFETTHPRENHICEPCAAENRLVCDVMAAYVGCDVALALLDR